MSASVKRTALPLPVILIASVLLLSAASVHAQSSSANPAASISPSKAIDHNAQTQNDHKVDNRQPPQLPDSSVESAVIKALRAITDEREAARKQYQANDKRWWPPSPSWAIVYVTIAYVVIAFFQLRSIGHQADIAEVSAAAAKKSADIAERSLSVSERPWISAQDWQLQKPEDPDGILVLQFNLRNFGKSPAWITNLLVKFTTIEAGSDFPPEPNYTSAFATLQLGVRGRIVPPGEFIKRDCLFEELVLTDLMQTRWKQGLMYFFVYGLVDYEDMHGEGHRTAFSAQYTIFRRPDMSPEPGGTETGEWNVDAGPETYHYHDRKHAKG